MVTLTMLERCSLVLKDGQLPPALKEHGTHLLVKIRSLKALIKALLSHLPLASPSLLPLLLLKALIKAVLIVAVCPLWLLNALIKADPFLSLFL